MTLDEYQQQATTTNLKKTDILQEYMHHVLGLGDEAGEVQSIFKKWIRDHDADPSKLDLMSIKKELGDVLWYVAIIAKDINVPLSDIASLNLDKLRSRQARGKIVGSGDNR